MSTHTWGSAFFSITVTDKVEIRDSSEVNLLSDSLTEDDDHALPQPSPPLIIRFNVFFIKIDFKESQNTIRNFFYCNIHLESISTFLGVRAPLGIARVKKKG